MNKKKRIIGWAFLASIIVFLLMLGDMLALSDIASDYVSQNVLESLKINIADKLPDWTATSGEWNMITISLFLKVSLMIVIIIGLGRSVKLMKL